MVTAIAENIEQLQKKLTDCLSQVKLGVAGRLVYFDSDLNCFILAVHSTSPEKTEEATQIAFNALSQSLTDELAEAGIGFAGKQI